MSQFCLPTISLRARVAICWLTVLATLIEVNVSVNIRPLRLTNVKIISQDKNILFFDRLIIGTNWEPTAVGHTVHKG